MPWRSFDPTVPISPPSLSGMSGSPFRNGRHSGVGCGGWGRISWGPGNRIDATVKQGVLSGTAAAEVLVFPPCRYTLCSKP